MMSTVGQFMGSNEVWNKANLNKIQPSETSQKPGQLQGRKLVDKDKKLNKIQVRVKNIQKKSSEESVQEKTINSEIQEAIAKYNSKDNIDQPL